MKLTSQTIKKYIYKINPKDYQKYFNNKFLDYDRKANKNAKSVWVCIPLVDINNKKRNLKPIECYVNDCECRQADYDSIQWYLKNIDKFYVNKEDQKYKQSNYQYYSNFSKNITLFTKENKWIYERCGLKVDFISFNDNEEYIATQKNKYKAVSKGFAAFDNRLEAIEYIQNYITKSEEYLYQIQQEKKNIVDKISKLQYQLKLKDNLLRKFQI